MTKIRVLIVDDSAFFLAAVAPIIEADEDIEVVGTAANGAVAVDLVNQLEPHVVVMDVNMPVMGGLEAVERIMAARPTPILLQTGDLNQRKQEISFEAMSRGALDLVAKPNLTREGAAEQAELRDRIRLVSGIPVIYRRRRKRRHSLAAGLEQVPPGSGGVAIVASTGGPPALADILAALPPDFSLPVLIVQHLANGFAHNLVSWLDGVSRLRVHLGRDGTKVQPGVVYVAPDEAHMSVHGGDRLRLDRTTDLIEGHRPSGTALLSSVARQWGRHAIGVVLTGMGTDGCTGLLDVRRAGGTTLSQDEATSIVYGMPRVAMENGASQRALPAIEIPEALVHAARRIQSAVRRSS